MAYSKSPQPLPLPYPWSPPRVPPELCLLSPIPNTNVWKNCLAQNRSPVPKRLGTAGLQNLNRQEHAFSSRASRRNTILLYYFPRTAETNLPHTHWLKTLILGLDGVAQWIECQSVNQKITGSVPSQGTCLGCGSGTRMRTREGQPINVSLKHQYFILSLSPTLSFSLEINKILKQAHNTYLKNTHKFYSLQVLEAGSTKSGCKQNHALKLSQGQST